jgi:hypothetical protein
MVAICHCPHCQKQTSSAFCVVVAVPRGSVHLMREPLSTFHDTGASGQPVLRQFCGSCGSAILSIIAAVPELEFIKAGTLDDTSWLNPTAELWCDTAQPWVKPDPSRHLFARNPPNMPSAAA